MGSSQKSPEKQKYRSSWEPPESFSLTNDVEPIFLAANCTIARNKQQTSQPFSSTPMNVEESLALSAWDDCGNMEDTNFDTKYDTKYDTRFDTNFDTKFDIREENSLDKNSSSSYSYSSDTNTVNTYDDDTASVTTCSTTTTSEFPTVLHVTLDDLIKFQERRKSLQNINSYNMIIDKTSSAVVNNKSKQKIVNFQDEVESSPGESSKSPVYLPPASTKLTKSTKSTKSNSTASNASNASNDSSTVKDNHSTHHEEVSEISVTPSLGITKILSKELADARNNKQNTLRGWVKLLWPQLKLPGPKQLSAKLNSASLLKRKLNPLVVGVLSMQKSVPMVITAIVKDTEHVNEGIGRNGQIRFTGKPLIIKGVYDPREYLLLHCPTFHNPPYYNGDPRIPWTDHFLLNKVLPRLSNEVIRIQNEVGLFLTVKETLLRGLQENHIYQCKCCTLNANNRCIITYTYREVREHLIMRHNLKNFNEEETIIVNPREYVMAFYDNLPPKIREK